VVRGPRDRDETRAVQAPRSAASALARVRRSCARVGASADEVRVRRVALVLDAIDGLFHDVFRARDDAWTYEEAFHYVPDGTPEAREKTLAYLLTLAAINYGSGYAPWLERDPPDSTYYTISTKLARAFEPQRLWDARNLLNRRADELAEFVGQPTSRARARELMERFASSLDQLGRFLLNRYDGRVIHFLEACRFDAETIVEALTAMPTFDDVCSHRGDTVCFYKKAQLFAADAARACRQYGWGEIHGTENLTMFADNAVVQVLRILGVLEVDRELAARINAAIPLDTCSPEEVELRASAVNAGHMLVEKFRQKNADGSLGVIELDYYLWKVSHEAPYLERADIRRHLTLGEFY